MTPFSFIFSRFAASCTLPTTKFGIPTWYKYLPGETTPTGECGILGDFTRGKLDSLLGIGLAAVEIMLFIAGILAVAYVIYGGFRYVLSQGEPENTKVAKDAILNAVIGLVIAVLASAIVRFIGASITT